MTLSGKVKLGLFLGLCGIGVALAAPVGPVEFPLINGITGILSYAPTTGLFSQGACANLSNGGTACAVNTGTSGATLGLLNSNKADSGTNTYAGPQSANVTTISAASSTLTPSGATNNYVTTLVHANTPFVLANFTTIPPAGTGGQIKVIQSSTGSDLITTWGSTYQTPGGTAAIVLSTAANAVDILSFYSDGTVVYLSPLLNFAH